MPGKKENDIQKGNINTDYDFSETLSDEERKDILLFMNSSIESIKHPTLNNNTDLNKIKADISKKISTGNYNFLYDYDINSLRQVSSELANGLYNNHQSDFFNKIYTKLNSIDNTNNFYNAINSVIQQKYTIHYNKIKSEFSENFLNKDNTYNSSLLSNYDIVDLQNLAAELSMGLADGQQSDFFNKIYTKLKDENTMNDLIDFMYETIHDKVLSFNKEYIINNVKTIPAMNKPSKKAFFDVLFSDWYTNKK